MIAEIKLKVMNKKNMMKNPVELLLELCLGLALNFLKEKKEYLNKTYIMTVPKTVTNGKKIYVSHIQAYKYKSHTISSLTSYSSFQDSSDLPRTLATVFLEIDINKSLIIFTTDSVITI